MCTRGSMTVSQGLSQSSGMPVLMASIVSENADWKLRGVPQPLSYTALFKFALSDSMSLALLVAQWHHFKRRVLITCSLVVRALS